MNNNKNYGLPRKGRKHTCPQCGAKKSFKRYIDFRTGKELADTCGICDHLNRCGYHYPPREFFHDHPDYDCREAWERPEAKKTASTAIKQELCTRSEHIAQTEFYDLAMVEETMKRKSPFHLWLEALPFNKERIQEVLQMYHVGATDYYVRKNNVNYGYAAVFWMIDEQMRIHDAKMIAYRCDGHRVQEWGDSWRRYCTRKGMQPQLQDTEKVLFGLHLLNTDKQKAICIVESEKTALICACIFPEYIWMATGGCGNLQKEKLQPLMERNLIIFPDSGEYQKWHHKMQESGHRHYKVVDFLEKCHPNTDVADIILRQIAESRK